MLLILNSVFSRVFRSVIGDVDWIPNSLFALAEPGVWYDPSDITTLFQDNLGVTPVTAPGQTVGRILDKSGRGNHATQATLAQRPTYGINPITGTRNLLTFTEQLDNAAWVKGNLNTTGTPPYINVAVSPSGETNADFMIESATNAQHNVRLSANMAAATTHTYSFFVKAAGRINITMNRFNSAVVPSFAHTFTLSGAGTSSGGIITALDNDWYRCSGSFTTTGAGVGGFIILLDNGTGTTYLGDGTSGVYIWGAQLELGSTATAYQKVVTQYEVTEAGVASVSYLAFDGVDDGMLTPTITPGTDKAQVFTGVRKLSDAAIGVVFEHSAVADTNNGALNLRAPNSAAAASFAIYSRGTTTVAVGTTASTNAAPVTKVVSGILDISAPRIVIRLDGTQVATSVASQGTGNYLAYPLYIGRRGGTTLPFNGRIYSLITRFGANLTTQQITSAETYVNSKTGAF